MQHASQRRLNPAEAAKFLEGLAGRRVRRCRSFKLRVPLALQLQQLLSLLGGALRRLRYSNPGVVGM